MTVAFFVMLGMDIFHADPNFRMVSGDMSLVTGRMTSVFNVGVSAAVSTFVILFFRLVYGPMKFKVIGVEMSGPAGPVTLWIFCFAVVAVFLRIM